MPIKVSNFLNTTIFSDIDPNFTKNPRIFSKLVCP